MAEAKAAMVVVDLEAEKCISIDVFIDDGTSVDPRMKCEQLWKSVKDDWPDYEVAYVSNDEADELATQRKLWQFGMCEDEDMAARLEEYNASKAASG